MIYYALNLNAKMYVGVPFKSLALTSIQFDHENELGILRKRLEQVGFTFPCIRCLSYKLHSSMVRIMQKHQKEQVKQVILVDEMDSAQ